MKAVNACADGIGFKIEIHIAVLFADHVHVRLKNDGCDLLLPRCGRFADEYVARFVPEGFQSEAFPGLHQVGNHFALFFGGAGNLVDGMEIFPYAVWL